MTGYFLNYKQQFLVIYSMIKELIIFVGLISLADGIQAKVVSLTGEIVLDSNNDGDAEATLTTDGLQLEGNFGLSTQSISSNTVIGQNSIVFVDSSSSNILVELPYAGNLQGKVFTIKKTSKANSVYISGGGNLIDEVDPIELSETVDGLPTVTLTSNGEQWFRIYSEYLSETVGSSNLVGWWKFDETSGTSVYDSSGQDNTGSLSNATLTDGYFNGGVNCDGSNDEVIIPDSTSYNFGTGDFTICFWFLKVQEGRGDPLSWKTADGSDDFGVILQSDETLDLYFRIDGAGGFGISNGSAYSLNEWHHAVILRTGSNLKSYIDGVADGTGTSSRDIDAIDVGTTITLGENNDAVDFEGKLDDFRLYNRSLTLAEIQALYRAR